MQTRRNLIANALECRLCCIKPSIYGIIINTETGKGRPFSDIHCDEWTLSCIDSYLTEFDSIDPINSKSSLVHVMALCRTGDKPLKLNCYL